MVRFGPIGRIQLNNLLESSISKISLTTNSGNLYKIGTANTNGTDYIVYLFTTSINTPVTADFTTDTYKIDYSCATSNLCYVFAVGGGGAGSPNGGGGGGAGGVVMMPVTLPIGSTSITISVGNGGTGSSGTVAGTNGYNSYVNFSGSASSNNIIARGGGCGELGGSSIPALSGGSGGGSSYDDINFGPANNNNNNFANSGGNTLVANLGGGGGGGSGVIGTAASRAFSGGNGIICTLPGIKDYTPSGKSVLSSYSWGGGGSGGVNSIFTDAAVESGGGTGGGGGGGRISGSSATFNANGGIGFNNGGAGVNGGNGGEGGVNTGGGGGGCGNTGSSGNGGSGIVAIAFPVIKESLLINNYNFANPVASSSNSIVSSNTAPYGWTVSGAGSYYILNGTGGDTSSFTGVNRFNACPYGNFFYTGSITNVVLSQNITLDANSNYTLLFSAALLSSFSGTFTITIGSNTVSSTTLSITSANVFWNTYTWNFTNVTAGSYTLNFSFSCPIGITQLLINDEGLRDGLIYKSYANNTTYINQTNALSYFTGATQTSSGTTKSINYSNTDFNALDTYTQSSSIPINFALSFSGYFIPTVTGVWTFTFNNDDVISFWLGTAFQTTSNLLSTVTTSNINNAIATTEINTPFFTTSDTLILSTLDYRSGKYTASASSTYPSVSSYVPYKSFIGTTLNYVGWVSDGTVNNTSYTPSTGLYAGTTKTNISGSGTITYISGEWLGLQLPYSLIITKYTLLPRSLPTGTNDFSIPQIWYIIASSDNTNWYIVDYQSVTISNYTALQTYTITGQTTAYSYFRIVILNKLPGGGGTNKWTSITQWNITGYPQSSSTYSTTLTDRTPYPMLLNYGQGANNAACKMGITPPSGTLTYDGTPYFFN